jgi:hypothetical protein
LIPLGDYWFKKEAVSSYVVEEGRIVGAVESTCKRRKSKSSAARRSGPCWRPIIEYQVDIAVTNRISSDVYQSVKPVINERVEVLVNSNNRYDAFVGGFTGYWFRTYVTAGLAVAFVLMVGILEAVNFRDVTARLKAVRIRRQEKNA